MKKIQVTMYQCEFCDETFEEKESCEKCEQDCKKSKSFELEYGTSFTAKTDLWCGAWKMCTSGKRYKIDYFDSEGNLYFAGDGGYAKYLYREEFENVIFHKESEEHK